MRLLTSFIAVAGLAEAILVTPGSPCSTSCGNVLDTTSSTDIVCKQDDYASEGLLFKECVECELHSDHVSGNQTDSQWMLYNLRYATSYCLFGVPDSTPCVTSEACGPFRLAMQHDNLTSNVDPYEYCNLWPVDDGVHLHNCNTCLQAGGEEYLSNFITVLQAGCEQKPEEGATVAIDGDIFSTANVTISDPTPRATVDPAWFDQGPLDVGAKAGIAAGGLVVILIIVGCFVVCRGKRRRRAFLRSYDPKVGRKSWPSPAHIGGMKEIVTTDTPLSQRPLRAWDDSPMTTASEQQQPFQRYFSPYSSQFNSPISATENKQPQWPVLGAERQMTPQEVERHIGLAIGGDDSTVDGDSKGKKPEEYEMHRVDGAYQYPPTDERSPPNNGPPEHQHEYQSHSHERSYSGSYRNFAGSRGGYH